MFPVTLLMNAVPVIVAPFRSPAELIVHRPPTAIYPVNVELEPNSLNGRLCRNPASLLKSIVNDAGVVPRFTNVIVVCHRHPRQDVLPRYHCCWCWKRSSGVPSGHLLRSLLAREPRKLSSLL